MNKFDKFNYYLIVSIFVLSFTKGALELLGLSEDILQLSIEGLIFILFFHSLFFIVKCKRIKGPGLFINFLLLSIILISFCLTNVSNIQLILFFRKAFIHYLFFYALFNLNISQIYKEKLIKLIIILFLIQIPAAFIKLAVLGGTLEKIVGSMSIGEGSLATIMPLMAISYLVANYLEFRKIKYIVLIFLFIAIGLISNKMGILYYSIFLYLILAVIYSKIKYFLPNAVLLRELFIGTILLSIIALLFISLNPRANPEHIVGGSIDLQYLKDWTEKYQTTDRGLGIEGDGRFDAPFVAFDRISNGGVINLLFGFGPGDIIKSSFTPYKKPLLMKYNIGYGGRIALVWILMQIGFVGMILLLLFHVLLFKKIWKIHKVESMNKQLSVFTLTVLGFIILYFIDFFSYSTQLIKNSGVATTYYFSIYYILSYKNNLEKEI